jgi:hypothetical protein
VAWLRRTCCDPNNEMTTPSTAQREPCLTRAVDSDHASVMTGAASSTSVPGAFPDKSLCLNDIRLTVHRLLHSIASISGRRRHLDRARRRPSPPTHSSSYGFLPDPPSLAASATWPTTAHKVCPVLVALYATCISPGTWPLSLASKNV